jgi:bacteriocin biosynthesis cyclodehydratase domain-containing protein
VTQDTATNNPVHVLSVGPFGRSVLRHLRSLRNDLTETDVVDNLVPLPSTWPVARMVALASWRQVPDLCELLNQVSFETRRPFIPVMQDSTAIRLGPVVVPGSGACWNCWMTRWRQHSGWTKERMSLLRHYSAHPEEGPRGYLESFAAMAAIRVSEVITALDQGCVVPGHIWQIEVLTGEITTGTAIGVHDCPWCGLGKPKQARSVSGLQEELAYLWPPESASQS